MRHCTNHCRACGGHFTSLSAFEAHRTGPFTDRSCTFEAKTLTGEYQLVEVEGGSCRLSDPEVPLLGVTLYEHRTAQLTRERFGRAQTQPPDGSAA